MARNSNTFHKLPALEKDEVLQNIDSASKHRIELSLSGEDIARHCRIYDFHRKQNV